MTTLGDNELSGRGGLLMRITQRDIDSFDALCDLTVSAIAERYARQFYCAVNGNSGKDLLAIPDKEQVH